MAGTGDVREGRSRHDANAMDIDSQARGSGDDRSNEHVARAAGVLADDDAASSTGEAMRGRPPE
jgi:hypothetical protein